MRWRSIAATFFSRTRRRAAHQYIKKKRGKDPQNVTEMMGLQLTQKPVLRDSYKKKNDYPMIPFTGSLLRLSHHPQMSMCSFVFYWWTNSISKKGGKGVLKSNRNGRNWESPNQIQPPSLEEYRQVCLPPCSHSTALRPSHSSSSWLPKHNVSLLNILH